MEWMAMKRAGKPAIVQKLARWSGRQPFEAWQFDVTDGGYIRFSSQRCVAT